MTFVGRAKLNHPALGTPGGSSLHSEIENLFTSISDQLGSRWKLYSDVANSATVTFEHGFAVPFEDLRVHIYTSTAGVQTRLTNLTGWTVEATSGFLQSKIDVTVPSSGGPYTFYLYVSQEPMSDKLSLTGGTISGELFLNHVVTDPKHGATKEYVDNLSQGLDVKDSVLVATTANITLSGTQTIDGVALVAGKRVLVKDQTAKSENGIYTVASGSWTRSSDMNSWGEVPGSFCFVEEGTLYADTGWVCTSDITGILGTNDINWSQFAGVGTYTADGEGLELTGNQFGLELDGNSLSKSGSGLKVNPTGDVVSGSLSSGVINATGYQDYTGISTPAQPESGKTRVYAKTDGKLYTQSPAGIESAVGSGGSIILVTKEGHGFEAADVGCPVYLNVSGDYVKARADTEATAEVAGVINRQVDANNFEVCLGGEVSSVGVNAASPLVPGEMYFLSPTTAGALQTAEPTVIGQVSKPIGIARTTSSISFFNMRGAMVGSVNARTDISLSNNGSKQIYTPPAGVVAGELQGFVEIDGSTDYRFHVQAQFAKNGAGTDWNMSYQVVGDTPPVGFSMSINSSGVISVALPSIASFGSAKINYAINAPAVGATFPLNIDSANLTNSGITGLTGTAATTAFTAGSGKIGETINAGVIGATTSGTTQVTATNNLSLTAGIWRIVYFDTTYRNASPGSATNNTCSARIYNSTDSSAVCTANHFHYITGTTGDYEGTYSGSFHLQAVVNITANKTFVGQFSGANANGTFTNRAAGSFFAVRVG